MDIAPQNDTQQPISDDQELAKALAGVMPGIEQPAAAATPAAPTPAADPATPTIMADLPDLPEIATAPAHEEVAEPAHPMPTPTIVASPAAPKESGDLDGIKKHALDELRPLLEKVDLAPAEKYYSYISLIRSTDDASLIPKAHEIAMQITDEKERANALLDIIREIDYITRQK